MFDDLDDMNDIPESKGFWRKVIETTCIILCAIVAFLLGCYITTVIINHFTENKTEEAWRHLPVNIEVVNPDEGLEITVRDDGINVYKEIEKAAEEVGEDISEMAEDIPVIEVAESPLEEKLKNGEISIPKIFRVFNYDFEPKSNVRDMTYELVYDEFIDEVAKYKEDGIVRYLVVPQAVFTINYGPEINSIGVPLYTDEFLPKWAATSYYSQLLFGLYPDIEGMLEEYGIADDPYFDLKPYLEYGDYQYTDGMITEEYGPFINFEENTLRISVRYCIFDTFTGDMFYSDYSEKVAFGKDEAPFDISVLEPIELGNDFKVTTSRVRLTPDYGYGSDVYLTVKLTDYEAELDKALEKKGEVIAVMEVYDKNGFLADQLVYDLAYVPDGVLTYYFDWSLIDPDSIDFSDVECRVKLAYTYDINNLPEDFSFPAESKWLYFKCK